MTNQSVLITVETTVHAPLAKVWSCFTQPEHIQKWNHASDDWHCPAAQNDLRTGGTFSYTMAAKDGSFQFDFGGTYDEVREKELIACTLGDGRTLRITFLSIPEGVKVVETFEAETQNSVELQQTGWQMILNNFKKCVEGE